MSQPEQNLKLNTSDPGFKKLVEEAIRSPEQAERYDPQTLAKQLAEMGRQAQAVSASANPIIQSDNNLAAPVPRKYSDHLVIIAACFALFCAGVIGWILSGTFAISPDLTKKSTSDPHPNEMPIELDASFALVREGQLIGLVGRTRVLARPGDDLRVNATTGGRPAFWLVVACRPDGTATRLRASEGVPDEAQAAITGHIAIDRPGDWRMVAFAELDANRRDALAKTLDEGILDEGSPKPIAVALEWHKGKASSPIQLGADPDLAKATEEWFRPWCVRLESKARTRLAAVGLPVNK